MTSLEEGSRALAAYLASSPSAAKEMRGIRVELAYKALVFGARALADYLADNPIENDAVLRSFVASYEMARRDYRQALAEGEAA